VCSHDDILCLLLNFLFPRVKARAGSVVINRFSFVCKERKLYCKDLLKVQSFGSQSLDYLDIARMMYVGSSKLTPVSLDTRKRQGFFNSML
jgi:hypothetical protein